MLKLPVLHPEILHALGTAGHASRVVITDGNYPHITRPHPRAKIVWANFMPGVIDAVTALTAVCRCVPVEAAHVMQPDRQGEWARGEEPPIWSKFREVLRDEAGFTSPLISKFKPEFNELAAGPETALVIATGETAIWANVMITIGVVI